MKKKTFLNALLSSKSISKRPAVNNPAQQVYKATSEQIKKGLEKPCASTGTPISELRGNAKTLAQLANIGGGSKETGGGGISKGLNTILYNEKAKTALEIQDKAQKALTKKK